MNITEKKILEVKARLNRLNRKIKLIDLLKGLSLFVVLVLLINLIISLTEYFGFNSVEERTILFFAGIVSTILLGLYFLLLPIIKLIKPFTSKEIFELAKLVGNRFPDIKDKLLNVIQLYESESDKINSNLADAAILSEIEKTKSVDFNLTASFDRLKTHMLALAAAILFSTALFAAFAGLRVSAHRILNYDIEFKIPAKIQFYIEPQNITVTKGENVKIKIVTIGEKPNEVTLLIKDRENQVFTGRTLYPDTNNVFNYQINSIKTSTIFYATANGIDSEQFEIRVINRPIISQLQLKIIPPKYSGLETTIQKENGNITALLGSKVELNISSNKYLEKGVVVFNNSTLNRLQINGKKGVTNFTITKNDKYRISIVDTNKNKNAYPIEYRIKTIVDNYPTIEIEKPEGDVTLTKSELINTQIKIGDDFGFSKLLLKHRLSFTSFGIPAEEYSSESISIDNNNVNQELFFIWETSKLMLAAGDIVTFYFEVFDNDYVSGPKSAKSKTFQLRVPTMEELFKSADIAQDQVELDLEETLKEAEKLKEDMKNLSNELKKDDKEITWDEKKKIEETAERFEKLQNKIKETQKKLNDAKKNLDDNNLLSKETLQKYNELQKLMDEMNSEDMKRALEKLQQEMQSMNRDKAQQSLDDMKFNEEMFKKSIERTLNLLKRIQVEQKMDEVIKRTEELQEKIDELKNKTEKSDISNESEKNDLAKKEEEISKQLEQLKEEMNKLQEKMSEFKEMPNDTMDKLQKEMDAQKNEELSEKMKEMLQEEMKMDAMEQMQQMSQNMEQMKNQMMQMQQQMQQQNQMQVLFEMMKGIENLISLSKDEEALKNKTEKSNPNSNQFMENIQAQQKISDGLDKTLRQLSDLSQKTFAITPEMGKALGNARMEMNKAMQAMQNRNSNMAMQGQTGAMKYLNEAASMMKGNMEQMMSGGSGGGMMSMMQQMQKMSQQQMGLNKLTQQLKQGGRLTPQQQAGLQRLSQQQEMIRKSLEQLNKESKERGESKTLTSNLEKILEEMREVITNMNTEKIDDDLIQSQKNILSKLLDAQRSINERDFEKNRESSSSNNFVRKSPGELKLNSEKDKIKDELLKIINEGYSKDYEDLIRKYYEILESENEISK
ncbi:MAG: hypothetical protein L3J41_03445 [Melioribacteraceae bacterium]|nr:hypothetical protein [Melioribacteraceae bacterium]